MRRTLGIVIAAVVVLVGALVVFIAMQPAAVHVERSTVVDATAADVWPHISDMRAFIAWSPWTELDPDQTSEFSDPSTGVGAWYTWEGNDDVGKGKMTITAIEPPTRVEQELVFIEPFPSEADVYVAVEEVADGTKVTWGFDTENDFMGKAASLFIDMDAMLGADFEKGLSNLAAMAEADAEAREAEAEKMAEAQEMAEGDEMAEGSEDAATP